MDLTLLPTLLPLAACLLDLGLGDPPRLPHPVRLLGKAADGLAPLARSGGPAAQKAKGAFCVLLLAGSAAGSAHFLASIPAVGLLFSLYLGYAGLALGQLLREGRAVLGLLERGDLPAARASLALLVTRDTAGLDAAGIRRALAETLAENLNDAFTAPFLYLAVAGPAGLWAYKTVSTLDSMWGYKTPQWRDAGWFAARADDVLAYAPARITGLLMIAVGFVLRLDAHAAYAHILEDAGKTASPNAGWPMAAAAWLLGAAVGGPASYFGQAKDKPVLGPAGTEWSDAKLRQLLRLGLATGLALALLAAGYALALRLV